MGYHTRKIEKGVLGESSKIREELEELEDAEKQGAKLLALCELSDIIGAIDKYLDKHHCCTTLEDLILMARMTAEAFKEGKR